MRGQTQYKTGMARAIGFALPLFLGENMRVSGEYEHEKRAKALRRAVFGALRCELGPEGREEEAFCGIASEKVYDALWAAMQSLAAAKDCELTGREVGYVVTIISGCNGVEWRIARTGAMPPAPLRHAYPTHLI